jgi:hypothetical protein
MDVEKKEVSLVCSSPPYADPLGILDGNHVNYSINADPFSILYQTRVDCLYDKCNKFIEILVSSLLILILLIFSIYQIVLGCYNCRLENNNLGWIRASFLWNIPLVLFILIQIVIIVRKNKALPLLVVLSFIWLYFLFLFWYSVMLGIYVEVGELTEIRNALNNATVVSLLPCPANYYRQVYILKIASWCSPCVLISMFCVPTSTKRSNSQMDKRKSRWGRFLFVIVRRWIDLTDKIFARHNGETVIERL